MNAKGRRKGGDRFVKLIYPLLESPAYKDLSPEATRILTEIMRRHNGMNNGEISLSVREAGKVAHCSKSTAGQKLIELQTHGFIAVVKKGRKTVRHATTWRITSERTMNGTSEKPATNEWKTWTKEKPIEVPIIGLEVRLEAQKVI